jgi:hypothetical protein
MLEIGDEATLDMLLKEIRSGRKLLDRRARYLHQKSHQETKGHGDKNVGGLGKFVGSMPADEFFFFATDPKYRGAEQDKGFLRDYWKRNPHLKAAEI